MSLHRFFRRRFPLRNRPRGIAFLCFILLVYGCGEEAIDNPLSGSVNEEGKTEKIVPISTPYYPMTVGNRWVYRNPDGSEWSRDVVQSEIILHDSYHSFAYNPPLGDRHSEFIKSPSYVVASDGILLHTKLIDINDAIWQTVLRSNRDSSGWAYGRKTINGVYFTRKRPEDALVLLWYYKIKATEYSNFTILHLPPDYPQKSKVFQMTISGNHPRGMPGFNHAFEAKVSIWGYTSFEPVVTTPVGRFENCLKIVYGTETTPLETLMFKPEPTNRLNRLKGSLEHLEHEISKELAVLVPMLKYNLKLQTMWLAPGVGPVKIETLDGYAELIDYEIKAVASSQ